MVLRSLVLVLMPMWMSMAAFYPIVDACTAAGVEHAVVWACQDCPHQLILETAKERGYDLICMASHGRNSFDALILGSEPQRVLALGTLPVLVVRDSGADLDRNHACPDSSASLT